ncbi:MAG: alpha-2-macroglobulin, partial [Bacteroides sp.]|nr:alpha-2-macroglobulin [Bacteroides sp.]
LTAMRRWLLTQKRTQAWESTLATADAVYALLLDGRQLPTDADGHTLLRLGRETLSTADATGAGLNYVKRSYTDPHALKQTELVVEKGSRGLSWGAVYARYELPIDEVQTAGKGMTLERQLYVERTANGQTVLQPLTRGEELRVGQVVVSRLVIRMDRTMEFVHLKDGRAACLEPVDVLSGYRRTSGASFYQEVKDAATHFFFDRLEKGVHLIEHRAYVAQAGQYAAAPATIQSMYAPEFTAHGAGMMLRVEAR